jgi:hypothetical protein
MGAFFVRDGRTLTTGQVARMCNVAPRTVSLWCDSGKLRGFRLPGKGGHGLGDRRFYPDDVAAFMRAHGMRVPPELSPRKVYAVWLTAAECPPGAERAENGFELALLCSQEHPRAVLVGDRDGVAAALELCRRVLAECPGCAVTLVLSEDAAGRAVPLEGVNVVVRPCDWQAVAAGCGLGA